MVGKQIYRGYPFCFQIADRHIGQLPGDPPAAVLRIGIHRTDIWRKILSATEVVFDNAQTAGDPSAAQAEIPAVFGITVQILIHTFQVRVLRHAPPCVEPFGGGIAQLRHIPQRDKFKAVQPFHPFLTARQ